MCTGAGQGHRTLNDQRQVVRALIFFLITFMQNFFQETLEDIDKNEDGFVDQDEYIGKCCYLFVM